MTRDIHFQPELQGASSNEYAVKVADFQWVRIPSGVVIVALLPIRTI